jgi:hypothetical protein
MRIQILIKYGFSLPHSDETEGMVIKIKDGFIRAATKATDTSTP